MPAFGQTGRWAHVDPNDGLLFERGQEVVCPSGRRARVSQYWSRPSHEYCGFAAIKYLDNGDTAIISLKLLRAWQPGVTYEPPPLLQINPIRLAPIC